MAGSLASTSVNTFATAKTGPNLWPAIDTILALGFSDNKTSRKFVFCKCSLRQINKKLSASGGIRYDYRNLDSKELLEGTDVKFSHFKKTFSNVSGSAGLSYDLAKDVTLKANAARGFRAPSIPELAANGEHEGTNRYEISDGWNLYRDLSAG